MTDSNKKPSLNVYVVTKTRDNKDIWHKVGAAWTHNDSEGINVQLDFPVGATDFVLRPPKDESA